MNLYDHVKIKRNGVIGTIVDIHDGIYIIEDDIKREPVDSTRYHSPWPLYDCTPSELELIEEY